MIDWPAHVEDDLASVLQELCRVAAPSGHEDRLSALVAERLKDLGLNPVTDRLGQVAATVGSGSGHNILVTAHLDQLGLVTTAVDDEGYVRAQRLGGVPERVLPGTPIVILSRNGDVPAVVGLKSHHLTPPEEKYRAQSVDHLYIDVGASSRKAAIELGIRPGDPCVYQFGWTALSGERFSTTSLDDRLGVTALLALADRLAEQHVDGAVTVAFSTQEEFHVRGTLALAKRYRPDVVINVDVAPATDTPDLRGTSQVRLGGGPVLSRLSFHGRGTLGGLIPHPALVAAVEEAASQRNVPLQYEAIVGLITDTAFLPMESPNGIAAVDLAIPVRYTHSPVETAQLSDLGDTVQLIYALVGLAPALDLRRGLERHVGRIL